MQDKVKTCKFSKEDYFSSKENNKINLLCELNKKKLLQKEYDNYYIEIEKVLDVIYKDLQGEIKIKKLEAFMDNEEKQLLKRLGLINLILPTYNPEKEYINYKKTIEAIKNDITELNSIKNSLLIFHRNIYQREIITISNIIEDIQEKNLNNYKSLKTKETIKNLKKLKEIVEDEEKVKDFLLFKVLYDEAYGNDQRKRFNNALDELNEIKKLLDNNASPSEIYDKNKEIFNIIKEKLRNNEAKIELFIYQMINYF